MYCLMGNSFVPKARCLKGFLRTTRDILESIEHLTTYGFDMRNSWAVLADYCY